MATFENLAELKKAQQTVADASVSLGSAIAAADAKLSKPTVGPGRNAYDALMSMKQTQKSWFDTAREFVTTGAISGVPATKEQVSKLLKLGSKMANDYSVGVTTVSQYTVSSIAVKALADTASRLFDIGNELAKAAESVLKGVATTIQWLPWLIVGAIVIPFGIKVYLAKRRGGTDAALETAGEGISAGRERAVSATKRAFSGGTLHGYRFKAHRR